MAEDTVEAKRKVHRELSASGSSEDANIAVGFFVAACAERCDRGVRRRKQTRPPGEFVSSANVLFAGSLLHIRNNARIINDLDVNRTVWYTPCSDMGYVSYLA
jgi:hypothetical protein